MRELIVLLNGSPVGVLQQDASGRRSFQYLQEISHSHKVSLALPIRRESYPQSKIDPFIEGVLPEGEGVRQAIADDFDVSPNNPFALLEHIGLDCAGAIQFAKPDDLEDVMERRGELTSFNEVQIGRRLRALISSPNSSWMVQGERWSLAGAQSKFALRWKNGWYEATGAEPTTHIFKPGIHDFQDQALNEHLCLRTLGIVGLDVAKTEYADFDGTSALVISRYDRAEVGGRVERLHQEDFCQATSTMPRNKYESNRGPSALVIIQAMRDARAAESEVQKFVTGLVANYLLGAPDAHAKNYSMMLKSSGTVELAPLYDIASGLPYEFKRDDGFPGRSDGLRKSAMAISGERRFGRVEKKHWLKFAADASLSYEWLEAAIDQLASEIPVAFRRVLDEEHEAIQDSDLPKRLLQPVTELCEITRAGLVA